MRFIILLCFISIGLSVLGTIYFGIRSKKSVRPRMSHKDALLRGAELEHENDMMPHTDPDIIAVCLHPDCKRARLPKPPTGSGGGSRNVFELGMTPNEVRTKLGHCDTRPPPDPAPEVTSFSRRPDPGMTREW